MEHLITLSQAKLLQEDLDSRCLRKAVLVQNALRHGAPLSPLAVVPADDPIPIVDGPGRLFRTTSTHDATLEIYQTRSPCPMPREHHPHFMVDVTDEVAGGLSPPSSPCEDSDAMDSSEYGVVPTRPPQMSPYIAQPLLVERLTCASSENADEEVPEYSFMSLGSGKRAASAQLASSMIAYEQVKRVCLETELAVASSNMVDWMQ